jgi:imidazole glycerol-phosphate synthase subunit HisH
MTNVAVIDYGMGNLRSVAKALEHVAGSAKVEVTASAQRIMQADRIVFPGQGAARDCMAELQRLGLDKVVQEAAHSKPFLGICMGLQVLLDASEENDGVPGLGIFPGQVRRFPAQMRDVQTNDVLKIPHMGWNQVHQTTAHPLWQGIAQDSRFYFVHSYYVDPEDSGQIAATAQYGVKFVCAMAHRNIFAVQFHPEKSHHAGLALLANFMRWDGNVT